MKVRNIRPLRWAAIAFLSLTLASCATTGSKPLGSAKTLEEFPTKIQRGVTGKAAVREYLGEPQKRQISPGGERWLYGSAAPRHETTVAGAVGNQVLSTGIGMIPYAGGALNSARSVARVSKSTKPGAWVDFDERGVVSDYAIEVH